MSSMLYTGNRKLTVCQIVVFYIVQAAAMNRSRMSGVPSKHGTLMLGVDP